MHCIVVVPSQDHMMDNNNLKRDIVMVSRNIHTQG